MTMHLRIHTDLARMHMAVWHCPRDQLGASFTAPREVPAEPVSPKTSSGLGCALRGPARTNRRRTAPCVTDTPSACPYRALRLRTGERRVMRVKRRGGWLSGEHGLAGLPRSGSHKIRNHKIRSEIIKYDIQVPTTLFLKF